MTEAAIPTPTCEDCDEPLTGCLASRRKRCQNCAADHYQARQDAFVAKQRALRALAAAESRVRWKNPRAIRSALLSAEDALRVLGRSFTRDEWVRRFYDEGAEKAGSRQWDRWRAFLREAGVVFVSDVEGRMILSPQAETKIALLLDATAPVDAPRKLLGWVPPTHWPECCGMCGDALTQKPGGRPRLWCGKDDDACRARARRQGWPRRDVRLFKPARVVGREASRTSDRGDRMGPFTRGGASCS